MSDNYTYVVPTPGPGSDVIAGTRHKAVGEKVIFEAIYPDRTFEVRTRKRYATDPV